MITLTDVELPEDHKHLQELLRCWVYVLSTDQQNLLHRMQKCQADDQCSPALERMIKFDPLPKLSE